METLIVVPRKKSDVKFLKEMLRSSSKVKEVKVKKKNKSQGKRKTLAQSLVSESSLAKEWLSKEDDRWDNLLK